MAISEKGMTMYGLYLLKNGEVLMSDNETILGPAEYQVGAYKPEYDSLGPQPLSDTNHPRHNNETDGK